LWTELTRSVCCPAIEVAPFAEAAPDVPVEAVPDAVEPVPVALLPVPVALLPDAVDPPLVLPLL
jgi:hypothetical protein